MEYRPILIASKWACFSSQWQHLSQQVAIDGGTLLYPDNLKLLENTLKWIKGYLSKATVNASTWWTNWLEHAHQLSQKTKSQPIKGESA